MIMVLSCFDLLVVITNQPILIVDLVLWINEKYDLLLTVRLVEHLVIMFPTFSIMTLLVMSIERYLGAYYPIFHRTSVTKRRLLTFLAILLILPFILIIISFNDMIISYAVFLVVFFLPVFPPIVFINYKLFRISRKVRRNRQRPRTQDNRQHNTTSPIVSSLHVNLKNISTCLLVVSCFVALYIPGIFSMVFSFTEKPMSENRRLSHVWCGSVATGNSTLNCLIFFWKNDVLRREGMKILKSVKTRLFCTKAGQV